MFRVSDLAGKVSELKLRDIINMGATEDDYNAGDVEEWEIKRPVRVTLNHELIHLSGIIMKQEDCSSNLFYKSATKHGAMILENMREMKIISDIRYFLDALTEIAVEYSDDFLYNKYSYYLFVPKSLVYRGVIALSLGTEFKKVQTAEEFYNNLKIYSREILNIEGMLSMFKFSTGFIKLKDKIEDKIKRKKFTDEVADIIENALGIEVNRNEERRV